MPKIGRNDRCPCGSGQKYKRCCMDKGWVAAQTKRADPQEQRQVPIEGLAPAMEEADEVDQASNSVVDLSLGNVHQTRGNLAQAESSLLVHLQLYEVLGSKDGMAAAYDNLGNLYQTLGDLAQAAAMYKESIALFQQLGATPQVQQLQKLLGQLTIARGRASSASSAS